MSGVRSTAFFHPYPGRSRKTASSSPDLRAGSPCVWSCCFHSSVNFLAELFPSKPALSEWASIQFLQMKRKQGETGEERRGEDGEGEEQMAGGRKQKRRDGPGPRPHNGRSDLPATDRTYRENLLKNQEERGKHNMNIAQTVYARWISKASLEQGVRG